MATVGYRPQLQIVDTGSWEQVRTVELDGAVVERVRWSPDGTRLAVVISDPVRFPPPPAATASGGEDCSPRVYGLAVYDPLTGTEIDATAVTGRSRYSGAPGFCWAPDSDCLAVITDGRVSLWRPGSGAAPTLLPMAEDEEFRSCDALDWHPEHGLLAHTAGTGSRLTGDGEGMLLRWADPLGAGLPEVWRHPALWGSGHGVAWRPGGRTAALHVPGAAVVVDPLAREVLWQEDHVSVHWSPDGGRLAVRHALRDPEGVLNLLRMPADAELSQGVLPEPAPEITLGVDHSVSDSLAWRPDGSAIATTSDKRSLKLWRPDASSGTVANRWAEGLSHVTWSTDGRTLAVRTTVTGSRLTLGGVWDRAPLIPSASEIPRSGIGGPRRWAPSGNGSRRACSGCWWSSRPMSGPTPWDAGSSRCGWLPRTPAIRPS
ncbi:hypothetical protein GCM10010307_41660 [Streptomyces vastus]|uniref:WD40 repeat domain-containing protein n=1 Tax=Streptomyces vastus TaxID=285451 RepID=A0ABN3R188_9ACTN